MVVLNEVKRSDLVAASKRSQKEKDGRTRYQKRVKSRIVSNVRNFNKIDMNKLFYDDLLTVDIDVIGETDKYTVKITFGGFLKRLQREIKDGKDFDLRSVIRALVNTFDSDDVYTSCTCPDHQYRIAYWSTKNGTNSGTPENRPSDITNPHDDKGPGCKHVMLVLANRSWLIKVASVIVNYVNYIQTHMERLYADVIYPAIYGEEYTEPVQLSLDGDELETSTDAIDRANQAARTKGQFKQGNDYRFTKGYNRDKNQISVDDEIDDIEG